MPPAAFYLAALFGVPWGILAVVWFRGRWKVLRR